MTGILQYTGPSMAAAIVTYTANQTAELAQSLSSGHASLLSGRRAYVNAVPDEAAEEAVTWAGAHTGASVSWGSLKRRKPMNLQMPDIDLGLNIKSFAADMLSTMDELFPGLRAAAQQALAKANAAIWAPTGHTHDEAAARAAVDAVHAQATYEAQKGGRAALAAAAAANHRFAPGRTMGGIAEAYGEAARTGIGAAGQMYRDTAEAEYTNRLKMARAALDARAQAISGFADAVTRAFAARAGAEAGVVREIISAVGGKIDTNLLRYSLKAQVDGLIAQAATEFASARAAAARIGNKSATDFKIVGTPYEHYVNATGAQAATLFNQLRGNAGIRGSDVDITDYEVIQG